jgi:hypothetical protein
MLAVSRNFSIVGHKHHAPLQNFVLRNRHVIVGDGPNAATFDINIFSLDVSVGLFAQNVLGNLVVD